MPWPDCPSILSSEHNIVSLDVANPPLVYTRVCRLWRVVAHSTPRVWSHIQIVLRVKIKPWKPFFPYFLQCWLARSGRLPLTLYIVDGFQHRIHGWVQPGANSRVLDVLLSESQRLETVLMSPVYSWDPDFDTPQLRTLVCNNRSLRRINAPKLSRLHFYGYFYLNVPDGQPTLTCRNLRLEAASTHAICSAIASFPHLETILVDEAVGFYYRDVPTPISSSVLKSMILPLAYVLKDTQQGHIHLFTRLHLPMLQKLTLVGAPEKVQVDCLLAMLAVASFQVPVVDFQTSTPLSTVHMNNIAPLLSIVREVTHDG
ncbi:uncharacterized protein BJ212DRAFT_549302 [Suillus subaureus]|uniref:F-box domain-containing protein n=1 Tax=Suillus subaureus TaxID=48587 RepID=A0A9P7JIS7_9AGAM|nr:uncharacterized protein BJ212DRAFT_549302 [Suillus subaureus]KAG1824833.1 hypothetical protein BJ212DRAFT_549302 [Suillus subaureus]